MTALEPLRVFVGYDPREIAAWNVTVASMRARCSESILIEPLILSRLQRAGLYGREFDIVGGQWIDRSDGRAFSTEFAFSRFLVPALCQWRGRALFCDSDFLWRADVAQLFAAFDCDKAVQVVKHKAHAVVSTKMRGAKNQNYPRKNWSSLMLFNCAHPANEALTPDVVSLRSGRWLHGFGWLENEQIGGLAHKWNHLDGHSTAADPAAVHFTRGTPNMPKWHDVAYADEWRAFA